MSRYAKSIVAFLAAAATWCTTALDDDRISNAEWAGLVAAVLGVLAVYQVRNSEPVEADEGVTMLEVCYVVIAVAVAVLALIALGVLNPR